MDYIWIPSLKHITLVKIAITLWNRNDIRALIMELGVPSCGSERKKWQEIENKVIEKVLQLSQPELFKREILGFIKPIGLQILQWLEYHSRNGFQYMVLPNNLFWTPQGTVDKKKTAEVLIKDGNLDITECYKLACFYCLENNILELWNKIPENGRKSFYSEEDPTNVIQDTIVVLWTYDIKGEVAKMSKLIERVCLHRPSPYQYAFDSAAVDGHKAATEYFLQKLTPGEREESLVSSIGCAVIMHRYFSPELADVLCFLLSQMNEDQKIEIFKRYPRKVLKCVLDWPRQTFFMETVNHMMNFLSEDDCYYILKEMVVKVIEGYKDCDYQKLFGKLWQQSSNAHKRYVIDKCTNGNLLSKLFKIKDEKNIKLILKDATFVEKKKLIFCDRGQDICQDLINSDDWDLLKLFMQECLTSRNEMIKFEKNCLKKYYLNSMNV